MSAFRVSRSAAEENDLIATFQFLASRAAFPAAKSGSSLVWAGASSVGSALAVAGSSTSPRPTRATVSLMPVTRSLAGQPLLHLAQLGPVAVRVACEARELLEVVTGLLRVAGGLGRLGRAIEAAQPHGGVLERGHVLLQRRLRLALCHQHVREQLPHRVQTILHRDVLLAGVFEISRGAHELQPVGLVTLAPREPGLSGKDLDLDLAGPVTLVALFQRRALLLQPFDVGLGRRWVTAAGGAHRAREVRDRVGHGEAGAERLQLRGALPVLTLQ